MTIPLELIIILLLVLANGVFAMAEIALISVKRSQLRKLADEGDARAISALALAEAPNRFLSTVQIGITLIGILAGAFGGATLADQIAGFLEPIGWLEPYRRSIGVGVVVVGLTFLSLIIGELVPKRIGLNNPLRTTLLVARPMNRLSRLTSPVIWLLSATTDGLLRIMGIQRRQDPLVSEDEVRTLVNQGLHAGIFHDMERAMVEGAFRLDHLSVQDLMTPRARLVWINVKDPDSTNWPRIVSSGHSYFPVFEGNRDNVLGLISVKSLWANHALQGQRSLRELVAKPIMIPVTMSATRLLEMFKKQGQHVALVVDEFGGIQGMVRLIDVMEAVVGELPTRQELNRPKYHRREDGSLLCDAMMEVVELKSLLQVDSMPGEEDGDYHSLAGFALHQLGRIPTEGECFDSVGHRFEIMDMDRHRIDKVLIVKLKAMPKEGQDPAPN